MALYDVPAEKPVFAYTDSNNSASKDSLLYSVSARRVLNITDLVVTNTHTSAVVVTVRYATSASSASAATAMKVGVAAGDTKNIRLVRPIRIPYGSGNKVYVNANVGSAKVGVTLTGYEQ